MTGVSIDTVDDNVLSPGDEAGTAPGDRRFRPDVEGLRAVAIVLVVLYHGGLKALSGGYVGVDVFFVISGFVITGLLLEGAFGQWSDLVPQLLRTSQPAHHPGCDGRDRSHRGRHLLGPGCGLWEPDGGRRALDGGLSWPTSTLPRSGRTTSIRLSRLHRCSTSGPWPSKSSSTWCIRPSSWPWPLSGARPRFELRLVIGLVVIIVASFTLSVLQTSSDPTVAYFSPFTRAWELALGALVAVATPWLLRTPRVIAGSDVAGSRGDRLLGGRLRRHHCLPGVARGHPGPRGRAGHCRRHGRPEVGGRVGPRAPTVPLGGEDLLLALSLALADPDHRR